MSRSRPRSGCRPCLLSPPYCPRRPGPATHGQRQADHRHRARPVGAPVRGGIDQISVPPCSSMIFFTMGRPSPCPFPASSHRVRTAARGLRAGRCRCRRCAGRPFPRRQRRGFRGNMPWGAPFSCKVSMASPAFFNRFVKRLPDHRRVQIRQHQRRIGQVGDKGHAGLARPLAAVTASRTSFTRSSSRVSGSGMRANLENSSTMRRRSLVWRTITST
jgi:hypothetical protein